LSGFQPVAQTTNVVTFSGKRAAHVLLTMDPEELNSCLHGTDVAGTHNTVVTKFAKTGNVRICDVKLSKI